MADPKQPATEAEHLARIADLEEQLRWCREANAFFKEQLTKAETAAGLLALRELLADWLDRLDPSGLAIEGPIHRLVADSRKALIDTAPAAAEIEARSEQPATDEAGQ